MLIRNASEIICGKFEYLIQQRRPRPLHTAVSQPNERILQQISLPRIQPYFSSVGSCSRRLAGGFDVQCFEHCSAAIYSSSEDRLDSHRRVRAALWTARLPAFFHPARRIADRISDAWTE